MTFTQLCVGLVITVLILAADLAISRIIGWMEDDEDVWLFYATFFACIGFGVCLTMLLYQNHIL